MSACPVNSPIQRLNFDILWHIFDINADMFEDHRALRTTLTTSRVCHSWRFLLLSSSSIWAHLIDLDHSLWLTVEGNREIIRRSGTALMWMKNHELLYSSSHLMGILNVIDANWTRIQRLEVNISIDHMDQWTPLHRPAPHLESFGVVFNREYFKFENLLPSLFGGDAPMLRDFRLEGHRFSFAPMSWLWQLCSLRFGGQLTVSQTLGLLLSTVNLTNLWLECKVVDKTVSTLPFVSLPELAHLDLNLWGELTPGAVLLEHLLIPPSCSVTFFALEIQRKEIDKKNDFEPVIRTISTCAQRCFSHHPPQELLVIITPSSFLLEVTHHSNEANFTFCLNLRTDHTFPGQTLTTLLTEFSLPVLCNVTFFAFRMTRVLRPVPGLTTFITCLPSVITIATEKLSLRHLRAYAPPKGGDTVPRIVFPALKTLRLGSFIPSKEERSRFDNVRDPVSKYVMARILRGHAISVIDFTEDTMDALPSMALLRKATGLKVLWQQSGVPEIQEYICGTSAPQKLVAV